MADNTRVSALPEATDAQMTDSALINVAVVDQTSSTGFTSKKSPLSKLAAYILNKLKPYSLTRGTALPSGADLDSYTAVGTYYSGSAAISGSLLHCPVTTVGFKLAVNETGYIDNYLLQTIEVYNRNDGRRVFARSLVSSSPVTWSDWVMQPVRTEIDTINSNNYYVFSNDTLLTSQIDALPIRKHYTGNINSYGHQSETGVPTNASYYVEAFTDNTNYKRAIIYPVGSNDVYMSDKHGANTDWGTWVKLPARAEIDTINSNLNNRLTGAIKSISANTETNITIPNNYRGSVAFIGYDIDCNGLLMVAASSGGTVTYKWIGDAPSNITLATGTRKLTVTSTQGVYLIFTNANQAIS